MALFLAFYLLMLRLSFTSAQQPNTSNKACIDGGSFLLRIGVYQDSCPEAEAIIYSWVERALFEDHRMAASLLRLHFHDCFVNGCGASVLLDNTPSCVGEKTAAPNLNSLGGFEVIDGIKSDLESICPPETVSCADILATVARDSVTLVCDVSHFHSPPEECELAVWCNVDQVGQVGKSRWEGGRDDLTASITAANKNIPGPNSSMATLVTKFQNVDLTLNDMVTLTGAHTMGKARCSTFSSRLNVNCNSNSPDINIDFLQSLQQLCSESNSDTTLAHLDLVTPSTFDNQYYVNLISGEGLFASDQILVTGDDQTREIVESNANNPAIFFEEFKNSMLKMGNLGPLTGEDGETAKTVGLSINFSSSTTPTCNGSVVWVIRFGSFL